MKANEAPEKIYILPDNRFPNGLSICWYEAHCRTDAIEYIRKDAFIEKVCEYFAQHIKDNSGGYDRAYILENFKKYMKG